MEIGIDSFAAAPTDKSINSSQAMSELIERMAFADEMGLDVFGIGQHYRADFLDSAPSMILAAAAARTNRIILTSAVTVLSSADPVREFQNYATLDLLSQGRAEMVVGRGSFVESFPLFGYRLDDYNELFAEKLELLLKIRDEETVTWKGKFRSQLHHQAIYPRPHQEKLPIWLGVGGTPASFVRAGKLGLPLMVAIIGGETHRFRPLIEAYKKAGAEEGHSPETLKVGIHSLGYVGRTSEVAIETYYPGYAKMFTEIGKERGWPPVTKDRFDDQNSYLGSMVVGNPEEVAEKILRHDKALGGISRFSFQMDAGMNHQELMSAIELIGKEVIPIIREA
mgnify:CR=1 FL=1